MVVVTRSRSGGGVKILTPSFRAASTRSYKIYTGGLKSTTKQKSPRWTKMNDEEPIIADQAEEAVYLSDDVTDVTDAVDAAATLSGMKTMNKYACMNPMHPVTRYMYRIQVFNSERTLHYKTAYIGYNNKNRLYYIHTIISNCYKNSFPDDDSHSDSSGLPLPVNTLQTKYSSYVTDSIENYIMTMVVPSREYDYFIQDDMIGVVTTESDFCDTVFGQESSYYDVERLLHDDSSNETINGYKAFSLIPSRSYWFDPLVAETHSTAYSAYTIHSVLSILSQSQ